MHFALPSLTPLVVIAAPGLAGSWFTGPGLGAPGVAVPGLALPAAQAATTLDGAVLDAIGHPARTIEANVRAFAALGPESLPRCFELAVARELSIAVDGSKSFVLPVSDEVEIALVAAAALAPRADVVRLLARVAATAAAPREVEVALRIAALAGTADDVELVRSLALRFATERGTPLEVRQAFGLAFHSIALRDDHALAHVRGLYLGVERSLADALLRALGALQDEASAEALGGLLGARPELDLRVLGELARVGRGLPLPAPESTREAVRSYLRDDEPTLQRAACRAAFALQDIDAVPVWIELLEGDDDVARAALDALRRTTRKALDRDAEEWRAWRERELADWRVAERRADELRSPDRAKAAAELLALGRAKLHRHQAAELVAGAFARDETDLLRLACQVLGELGSPAGEAALVDATEHADASVREAAELALERVRERQRERAGEREP
ncbi:MAG: hypothetical protein L6Q99_18160 [Planctomycetes bacterium]|nr:hypothetical protein [Planctomycetota bacterium]